MSSPNDFSPKVAPSIWSLDSGYETNPVLEDAHAVAAQSASSSHGPQNSRQPQRLIGLGLGEFWNAQVRSRIWPREDPPVSPLTTKLDVFTTSDASDRDFVLPEIPTFDQNCMECDLWQRTSPGTKATCHNCQAPDFLEPFSGSANESFSTSTAILPRLDIPEGTEGKGLKRHHSTTRCSACEVSVLIDSKYCPSCCPDQTFAPSPSQHRVKRSRAGRNSKLPISALNILQSWLDSNQDNPYPSAETKRLLAQECGITEKQVNTWFTNARARQMNPVESGSELDVADDSDDGQFPQANQGPSAYPFDSVRAEQSYRRASVASQPRMRPSRRGKKKDYRRNPNAEVPQTPLLLSPASITSPVDQPHASDQEIWQCTFCLKALVPKSWRRHEDTQHRPKAQAARWTCMLYGPRLSSSNRSDSASMCAFCMERNPSEEHFLQNHRIEDCARRNATDRTFYRPDHLRQHVKNFHNATLFDSVQARWKKAAETVAEGWTCGFCGDRLQTWDKRETHIADHFKKGMTMASWREFPDMENPADKTKSKGELQGTVHSPSHIRISNPFRRPTSTHPHPHHLNQLQNAPFANTFQPLPLPSQTQPHNHNHNHNHYHNHNLQPPPPPYCSTTYPPPTTPLNLPPTQAPVLPTIPTLDPLMLDMFGNCIDWSSLPTTLDQQMQSPLPNTSIFDAGSGTTTAAAAAAQQQQDFGNALGMELFGEEMEYRGEWGLQRGEQYPQRRG